MPWMNNIRSSVFRRARTVMVSQSPFTGKVSRAGMQDDRWLCEFEYRPMKLADAASLLAAIEGQRGGTGTFFVYDPEQGTPLSGVSTDGLVNGASQSGTSLVTDGWTASAAIASAGDYVFVYTLSIATEGGSGYGWQMFRCTAAVTANGSGQATFTLDAPLRASPADNATVSLRPAVTSGLRIPMRLVEHNIAPVGPDGFYSISIKGEEVVI